MKILLGKPYKHTVLNQNTHTYISPHTHTHIYIYVCVRIWFEGLEETKV